VRPAQQLFVEVGGTGKEFNAAKETCGSTTCDVAAGGFNGGGESHSWGWAGWPGFTGGGGGGASDVQTQSIGSGWKAALPTRLIVAGGGGGQGGTAVRLKPSVKTATGGFGGYVFGPIGDGEEGETLLVKGDLGGGGGRIGGSGAGGKGGIRGGASHGPEGGTILGSGYLIAFAGVDGELGVGGNGGTTWNKIPTPGAGGGGGGGYYGGGGGGGGSVYDSEVTHERESDAGAGGGGGAGSSYAPGGTTGWASSYSGPNGEVIITYSGGEAKVPEDHSDLHADPRDATL
jgi:hypothetical protein